MGKERPYLEGDVPVGGGLERLGSRRNAILCILEFFGRGKRGRAGGKPRGGGFEKK